MEVMSFLLRLKNRAGRAEKSLAVDSSETCRDLSGGGQLRLKALLGS